MPTNSQLALQGASGAIGLAGAAASGASGTTLGFDSAATAASFIPVVGPLIGGVLSAIGGIFGAHHAQAVANEAAALNQAVPLVYQSWTGVINAVDSATLTPQQADSALDQTLSGYENLVYNQDKVKRKSGNGPDYIEGLLKTDVSQLESAVNAGSGTVSIAPIPSHAGFGGAPGSTFTVSKPVSAQSLTTSLATAPSLNIGGSSISIWWIVAAFVLLLLLRR